MKQDNRLGILIYFSVIILLGVGLFFAEHTLFEQYFHPSQTVRTFAILMYITFAFFWDGSILLDSKEKNRIFTINGDVIAEKHPRGQHNNSET